MKMLAAIVLTTVSALAADISFSKLKAGEEIHIAYSVEGCFFTGTNELRVVRSDKFKAVLLASSEVTGGWTNKNKVPVEKTLTKVEVAGLDAMLERYGTTLNVYSTTQETLMLVHKRGTNIIATKKIVDSSGVAFGSDKMNMRRLITQLQSLQR